eukprot:scaffold133439_cov20-Tisochrysis_lutea.AAC.1
MQGTEGGELSAEAAELMLASHMDLIVQVRGGDAQGHPVILGGTSTHDNGSAAPQPVTLAHQPKALAELPPPGPLPHTLCWTPTEVDPCFYDP